MSSKFEVMDDACSQTFAPKLVQYFSIFVPKIQAKSQNQMAVKACIFLPPPPPPPPKKKINRFLEIWFIWLITTTFTGCENKSK